MIECPECGVEFRALFSPTRPLTDGLGRYYLGRTCPNCDAVLMRIYANRERGNELQPRFREQATLDPNPPPTSEMPDTFVGEDGKPIDVRADE